MIATAEKCYSKTYLKKFRKIYPLIGLLGKPKSYNRFNINAKSILSFNAYEELYKINCPTLIIAGENDNIVGVQASYELKNKISNSRLFVYKGLGHSAYEEADFNFLQECN